MSTHIVDRIVWTRIPAAACAHYEDVFIASELGGDNNVINCSTGRRARDWSPIAIGVGWQAISHVCERAGACEGGMLKLHGRWTKPESYIRAHRTAMEQSVEKPPGFWFEFQTCISDEAKNNGSKWVHHKLSEFRPPERKDIYLMGQCDVWTFDRNQPADMQAWLGAHLDAPWHRVKVHGPSDLL